jgi:hypothetical protein
MEQMAVEVAPSGMGAEIFHSFGCFVRVQLDVNVAIGCVYNCPEKYWNYFGYYKSTTLINHK